MENDNKLLIQSIKKLNGEELVNLKLSIEKENDLSEKIKNLGTIDPETLHRPMTF